MSKAYWKTDWFIGLVTVLLLLLGSVTEPMQNLEWFAYDIGVRFSSTDPANSDVVVVAIDEPALEQVGAWPWSRDIMADLTTRLSANNPSVIGYAIPLDTEETSHGLEYINELQQLVENDRRKSIRKIKRLLKQAENSMQTDELFANSLRRAGRVVLAMPYLIEKGRPHTGEVELPSYLNKYLLRDIQGRPDPDVFLADWRPQPVSLADVVYPPIESLAKFAGGAGVLNLGYGGERRIRTEPLVVRYGDSYLPSFSLMMVARNRQLPTRSILVDLNKGVELEDYLIPTDGKQRIYPHFYRGRKDEPAFRVFSALDVLNETVDSEAFRGKTVLVGLSARQHINPMITPIGEVMAPVMISAHTVSSLLNEELFKVPEWTTRARLLVFAAVALYLMYLLPRFRLGTGLAITALLVVVLLNAHLFLMLSESVWLQLMTPLMALLIGHLVLSGKHYIERRLTHIHSELSEANRALAQSFHSQGQLDQAFEKYQKCEIDQSLLGHIYNLGLDFERKRQFNKAITAFRLIKGHDSDYNDIKERIKRNQEALNAAVMGSSRGGAGAANGTLVLSTTGLQKPMLGRYRVEKEVGRGAMGMVYMGYDPKIDRTVAIKTLGLSQEFEGDKLAEVKARFFREAETAGRLNHPNIVTIYDAGEDQELAYIAMDFLKGNNLMTWSKFEDLLPAKEVLQIMIQVAEALDYAHRQNVVHRDIKPANIIYDPDNGKLTVTDFGVACLTDTSKTKTGTILGSPSYMSPEQLAGQKVDGRSDLFSLGVTFYQLMSGELPFVADSLTSLMYKIANEKHPDIRMFRADLPTCVSQIANKALKKDPDDRFQTGEQMASAMRRCLERVSGKKKKTGRTSS